MKKYKKYFLERLIARIIDYLFLLIIANLLFLFNWEGINVLGMYIAYNLLVGLFQGKTIGKWVLRLEVKTSSFLSSFFREFFFFFFFPFVAIHFCFSSSRVLHELLSRSYLVRK